ncbi:MAG: transposase [Deltaproteobacteria bacterium]|jgi:transposase|nr:transposase [Deltaproteobacteria bacterium]
MKQLHAVAPCKCSWPVSTENFCNAPLVTDWHNWQPMYLPPYWPEFNPIERIWLTIKARWFNNHVCKNEKKLLERLDQPILDVIDKPEKTQQTTAIGTLF